MNSITEIISDYALLDSGEGARLEKFGDKILIRPSKFAIWKKRFPKEWNAADATFIHKAGWKFNHGKNFERWSCTVNGHPFWLRLQDNGQVGLFPEHASYLSELKTACAPSIKVLNLFAFTGLASCVALSAGAEVTHLDLSKKALDWAGENFTSHELAEKKVRFIRDDAVAFIKKEIKRGNKYDIIIADPPSFSRISQKESWDLENILGEFLTELSACRAEHGAMYVTSHHFESGGEVMANLLHDALSTSPKPYTITSTALTIPENRTPRVLPAGFFVHVKW